MKTITLTKKDCSDTLTICINKKTLRIHALVDQTGNSWTINKEDLE